MEMITATNVTKTFDGKAALNELTLHVQKGSIYGLIGPNGAGKTTFIKTLMGIYRPDDGDILLSGKRVYENEPIKEKIAFVCDDLFFYTTYSILQTAKLYAGLYPNWSWELFHKLHDIYKIDLTRKVIRLSKGMQKQVAFWLGLSAQPEVMVLDEPIDGLDPVMRRNTWKLILNEVSLRDMTVLISSHNLRELEDVCDHVGIMHEGKVVIEKSLDDMKGNIHKIQLAFPRTERENADGGEEIPLWKKATESLSVLHESHVGSVTSLIIKGDAEQIRNAILPYHPAVFDILPLTLEEVFIYELGGMGYEFENILI